MSSKKYLKMNKIDKRGYKKNETQLVTRGKLSRANLVFLNKIYKFKYLVDLATASILLHHLT